MNSFRVFKPHKEFYLTNNKVIYSLFIIGFVPGLVEAYIFPRTGSLDEISKFSQACVIIGFMAYFVGTIFLYFMGMYKYKPFRGELLGLVYFYNDKIVVEDQEYLLKDIKDIVIIANDYSGLTDYTRGNFNWKVSNGTGNSITLEQTDGKKITFYFQILREFGILQIREQLIQYHLAGKISWLHLLNLLGLTNYDEIQEFKKLLNNINLG